MLLVARKPFADHANKQVQLAVVADMGQSCIPSECQTQVEV